MTNSHAPESQPTNTTNARRLEDPAIVVVQRNWNDWRTAMVRVNDLENVHWHHPAGAPRPLIHASVRCTQILSGDPMHDCTSTGSPHVILVCLLKSHIAPCVYDRLARIADEQGRVEWPPIAPAFVTDIRHVVRRVSVSR